MRTRRVLLTVFMVGAVTGLGEGVFLALFPPFVRVALDGGALELGWLMSAQAVGGVFGGLVVGSAAARLSQSRLLGLGAVLFGLIDLVIFVYPSFVQSIGVGLALFVLVGIPATALLAGLQTLLQTSAEDRFRGRVFGALGTTQALLMLAGTLLGGVSGDGVGIVPVLVVQGGAYVEAGALVLILLAPVGKRAVPMAARCRLPGCSFPSGRVRAAGRISPGSGPCSGVLSPPNPRWSYAVLASPSRGVARRGTRSQRRASPARRRGGGYGSGAARSRSSPGSL